TLGRVAQRERGSAGSVDFFELALREKPHRAAVRRPERINGALSACECLRRERIEGTNPEKISASGSRGDESEPSAIGSDGHGCSRSAAEIEGRTFRWWTHPRH